LTSHPDARSGVSLTASTECPRLRSLIDSAVVEERPSSVVFNALQRLMFGARAPSS